MTNFRIVYLVGAAVLAMLCPNLAKAEGKHALKCAGTVTPIAASQAPVGSAITVLIDEDSNSIRFQHMELQFVRNDQDGIGFTGPAAIGYAEPGTAKGSLDRYSGDFEVTISMPKSDSPYSRSFYKCFPTSALF